MLLSERRRLCQHAIELPLHIASFSYSYESIGTLVQGQGGFPELFLYALEMTSNVGSSGESFELPEKLQGNVLSSALQLEL